MAQGSFNASDIAPLAGREPVGDLEAPSVLNFTDFVRVLKAGKIYMNVHSKLSPAGLMRGNLEMVTGMAAGSPMAESMVVQAPASESMASSPMAESMTAAPMAESMTGSPMAESMAAPVAEAPAAEAPSSMAG